MAPLSLRDKQCGLPCSWDAFKMSDQISKLHNYYYISYNISVVKLNMIGHDNINYGTTLLLILETIIN